MKKSLGLKKTVLALLEKRCSDHIVDSGSGFLASSFQFIIGRVLNKEMNNQGIHTIFSKKIVLVEYELNPTLIERAPLKYRHQLRGLQPMWGGYSDMHHARIIVILPELCSLLPMTMLVFVTEQSFVRKYESW